MTIDDARNAAVVHPSAASGTDYIDGLLTSSVYSWSASAGTAASVTYGFVTALPSDYAGTDAEASGFTAFTTTQRTQAATALGLWAEVANLTFTAAGTASNAQIRFGSAALTSGVSAWAFYPDGSAKEGDVWLSASVTANATPTKGTAGFLNLLHAIGHALGLKHSDTTDDGGGGGGAEPPYISTSPGTAYDTWQYTIMSATAAAGSSAYPLTPMLYDIAAVQYLYGANTTTRSGDTTYSWAWEANELQTIWDGGGSDTLDASNQTRNQVLDLRAGYFSSIGVGTSNVAIAHNVTIENAKGGAGRDTIHGNSSDNTLTGGAGNDTYVLSGTWGNDFISDTGSNQIQLDSSPSALKIGRSGRNLVIVRTASGETLTVENVWDASSGGARQNWTVLANGQSLSIDLSTNAPPVATASDGKIRPGGSVSAASLFSLSDTNGDATEKYQFWDGGSASTSGYFAISGVQQTAGALINVSASDLPNTTYVGGASGGETVWVRAFDGFDWGEWVSWTMTSANSVPTATPTATGKSLTSGATATIADLFTIADGDGDSITKYELWDSGDASSSGYFSVNGTAQDPVTAITVNAADIGATLFVAGASNGTETVWIRAYDGSDWSEWAHLDATTTGGNRAPSTAGNSSTVGAYSQTLVSSLFSTTDLDGDTMTQYQFWDSGTASASGHFKVDGVQQGTGAAISVTSAQLSSTYYVGGSADGAETVWVRAYDGTDWSAWTSWTMTTDNLPVSLTVSGREVGLNNQVSAALLFSATDPESASITEYQFWDGSSASTSGYLTKSGTKQSAGKVISVTPVELGQTAYVGGSADGAELVWVRVNDGGDWSEWVAWTMTSRASGTGPTITASSHDVAFNTGVSVSSLIQTSLPSGTSATQYEFWDSNAAANSGYFAIGGAKQAANQTISVTAGQLSSTTFVGGGTAGPELVWGRVNNGAEWSGWTSWLMTTARTSSRSATAPAAPTNAFDTGANTRLETPLAAR